MYTWYLAWGQRGTGSGSISFGAIPTADVSSLNVSASATTSVTANAGSPVLSANVDTAETATTNYDSTATRECLL
jgi:hypothetical protein